MIDLVFGWIKTYALAIVSVVALAGWGSVGVQSYRLATTNTKLANEQAGRAQDRLQAEAAARLASENYRLRERAWREATEKQIKEANVQAERERADRLIADAAAGRLRERIAALVASARQAATAAPASQGSTSTEDASGMLADVLGRCIQRVQLLAEVADARGIAGSTCERISDEVRAGE